MEESSEQRIWGFSLYLFRLAQREAEAMGIIHTTKIAHQKAWRFIRLESDSTLIMAFSKHDLIPWRLKNRWMKCMEILKHVFSYITYYREGDRGADDSPASFGIKSQCYFCGKVFLPLILISLDFVCGFG